jgi:hypothetical protein
MLIPNSFKWVIGEELLILSFSDIEVFASAFYLELV